MQDPEFDFTNEIDKANWELLKPHHTRGALFLLSSELELATVANALSKDLVNQVKIWLDNKQFKKFENEDILTEWDEDNKKHIAEFIIIQPYVLIKLIQS